MPLPEFPSSDSEPEDDGQCECPEISHTCDKYIKMSDQTDLIEFSIQNESDQYVRIYMSAFSLSVPSELGLKLESGKYKLCLCALDDFVKRKTMIAINSKQKKKITVNGVNDSVLSIEILPKCTVPSLVELATIACKYEAPEEYPVHIKDMLKYNFLRFKIMTGLNWSRAFFQKTCDCFYPKEKIKRSLPIPYWLEESSDSESTQYRTSSDSESETN
jgi:hypothetical protein